MRVPLSLRSILLAVFLLGGFAFKVAPWALSLSGAQALLLVVGWIALANGASYLLLRCPACRKWACLTPSGGSTFWPGSKCRYCGVKY